MPDDLAQLDELQRKIEAGLAAARELKRLDAERKKRERPKLRLIKGGLIGGAIWAGVEWLCGYRRTVAALALSGLTVGGVFIAEQPNSPGSDPPETIKPPASVRPSAKPPTIKPIVKPRSPRTSPLRTPAKNSIPPAIPPSPKPTPTRTPKPTTTPSETPSVIPTLSLTKTPLPELPVETPALVTESCTINLLGIKLCLPLG